MTLVSPELQAPAATLRACVVVPAHDEEALVGACVRALVDQVGVAADEFEILLVLDRCTDATAEVARAAASADPAPPLYVVETPLPGVGNARRLGMDLAWDRLAAVGRGDIGLITCTDADSVAEPGWLSAQLDAVARGHHAIGGRIELHPADRAQLPAAALLRRDRDAQDRWERVRGDLRPGELAEHWQFSGASLGVTADAYRRAGGIEPRAALEDEAFERSLRSHGIPIARLGSVQVATSGRRERRAPRGLATDLRRAWWLAERSYDAADFTLGRLLAAKGARTVSLVLPTREVAETIGAVLDVATPLRERGLLDEILVVDAASRDGTATIAGERADVRVVDESRLRPELGPARGKGDAMWRGLAATTGDVVVYADTDSRDFTPAFLLGVLGPVLVEPEVRFVKGAFRRPFDTGDGRPIADGGGRVTELVARPLLNLHAPVLAGFRQPLAGEIAAERSLLEAIPFPVGYGVEIAMMLDVERLAGVEAMAQVDLGTRQNRHQSLQALSAMAYAVLAAAERRIHGEATFAATAPGPLLVPHDGDFRTRSVDVDERPPLAGGG